MQLQSKIPEEVFRKIKYLHEAVMHRRVKPYGCQLLMKLRTSPKSQKLQKKDFAGLSQRLSFQAQRTSCTHSCGFLWHSYNRGVFRTPSNIQDGAFNLNN